MKAHRKTSGGYFNPLTDPENPSDELIRSMNAKGVKTKVGGAEVNDFAVLKQGTETKGWRHIEVNDHHNHIMNEFRLDDNNEAVKDFIAKGAENYQYKTLNPSGGHRLYYQPEGASKYLRVVVNENGEIINAFPSKKVV